MTNIQNSFNLCFLRVIFECTDLVGEVDYDFFCANCGKLAITSDGVYNYERVKKKFSVNF